MTPWRVFCWHCLAFAWFVFVVRRIATRVDLTSHVVERLPPEFVPYGGPWKFLTVLNLLLQTVLFGVALVVDVFMLMKQQQIAKLVLSFRDLLFGSLAFPVSMFVFSSFWGLFLYDQELVYPKRIAELFPVWVNHAMHTLISPAVLIELCITPHRYPSQRKRLTLLGIGGLGYISCMLWIYIITGIWVYPIFHSLNLLGKVAFFLGSIGVAVLYSNVGAFLCRMIWGDDVVILDTAKKKSK